MALSKALLKVGLIIGGLFVFLAWAVHLVFAVAIYEIIKIIFLAIIKDNQDTLLENQKKKD